MNPDILRLPLAGGTNFYAARNALELSVMREEQRILQKQIAAWEAALAKPDKPEKCMDVVLSVFNGHPLRQCEVLKRVAESVGSRYAKQTVVQALSTAKATGRLINQNRKWCRPG